MGTRRRLSAHFTIEEFDCHDGSTVPAKALLQLTKFCVHVLEPMRAVFGRCDVISGFRTPTYNTKVGGASKSAHMYGLGGGLNAVGGDFRFARGSLADWAAVANFLLSASYAPGGGLGTYPRRGGQGWIHLDTRSGRARWNG